MADIDRFEDDEEPLRPGDRWEDDLRRFKEMLGKDGKDINSPEALEEIIQFYFEHEKFEEALAYTDKLITFEPFNADAWHDLQQPLQI